MNSKLDKYLKRYPELKNMFSSFVFVPQSVFVSYMNDIKINYKNMEISCLLLIDLVSSIYFEEKMEKLFDGEIKDIKIGYEFNDDLCCDSLTRREIIEAFTLMADTGILNIPENIYNRFEKYKEKILYDKLIEDSKNKYYEIEIDKKRYNILISDMLCMMNLSSERILEICNNDEIETIGNIKKEYFFYATYKYMKKKKIIENYLVPDEVEKNYNRLSNMEIIDFEAVNKFYNPDEDIDKIKLSEELKTEIFKNMPSNLNKLEKAMYIYLKMCKLLSYDEEFFFANREAAVLIKHKDIEHIKKVTLKKNGVVCYEFISIYAIMLLEKLGINSQFNNSIKESYGTTYHTMLDFRCGKYLVSADSLTSVLNGDIINVKLNGVINGFTCNNKSEKTSLEFYKMLGKVYKIVKEEEETKQFNVSDFDNSNIIEKLNIVIEKLKFKGYKGIDFISYTVKLYRLLFNEEERTNNIKISIVKDYKDYLHGAVVFCVNTQGFNIGEENTYYLFDSRGTILTLNRIELQELFDNEVVSYYDELQYDLPGIIRTLKR